MLGAKAGSGTHGIDDRAPARIFSSGTSARSETAFVRAQETRIGCNVLNRMAELGKPESQAIVGE